MEWTDVTTHTLHWWNSRAIQGVYKGIYTPKIVMHCTSRKHCSYWCHRLWRLKLYLKIYTPKWSPGYATVAIDCRTCHSAGFTMIHGSVRYKCVARALWRLLHFSSIFRCLAMPFYGWKIAFYRQCDPNFVRPCLAGLNTIDQVLNLRLSEHVSDLPAHSPATSSYYLNLPLSPSITPSLFHSRLKTYLFHKSFPP